MSADPKMLPLARAYKWEKERADKIYMTQPVGDGKVDEFSWKRTMDEARRMATYLKSLGYEEGASIGILSKNCAHFIMTDLAIWMAGYKSVALYPTLNADTVQYTLEHSEAKMLFVGKLDTWDEMKAGVPDDMPCVSYPLSPPNDFPTWNDLIKEHEPFEESPERDGDDIALLIYTSGSTGQPKGVIITFNNMGVATSGITSVFPINEQDRQLSYLPLAHSFERQVVENVSITYCTHIFFAESLDTFAADLRRARPTVFHSVPRLWLKFQLGVFSKMPEKKLNRLLKIPVVSGIIKKKLLTALGLEEARVAFSGSAPIPGELIDWYRTLGLELLEGYAMSENFAYSHVNLPGKTRAGYVGNTLPGVECRISEEGEIQVKSGANMTGYFKNDDATKETFTDDGWLKTGDRGEIDAQGRLRITGRVKELFKTSKGKYIAPVPIENIINANNNVEQSCVSGSGYPMAHAVVMLSEDLRKALNGGNGKKDQVTKELEGLLATVNKTVEHHEQLQFLAVAKDEWQIENGFLTPTMKIKRSVLEDTYGPKFDGWYDTKEKVIWE